MRKKGKLVPIILFTLFLCVTTSQAALYELDIPDTVGPGPGSLTFDVMLTDLEEMSAIDGFNIWLQVSGEGAGALSANADAYTADSYIFPSSFSYVTGNTDLLAVYAAGNSNDTGTTGLLAQLTFDFAGVPGQIYTFSLVDPEQNFGTLTGGENFLLSLSGNTTITVTPIPAAVWLLGSSLLGLLGVRRMKS